MKEVFISYSSNDLAQAETVRNVLEKNGLSCWMAPRDIPGGSNYTKEIPIAIRNCKVFVLILSKSAQGSHWVLKELDSAVNSGKVILPFMLEDCALNDEFNFLLTGAQRYSAYQKKAEAMETLISRIRGILDVPSPVKTEQAEPVTDSKPAAKKAAVNLFCDAVCPACGSDDLKERKGKVKCETAEEHLTKLWVPVLAVLFGFAGLLLASFILPYDYFNYVFILVGVCAIAGGFLGSRLSRNTVTRKRLRSGVASTCYRCNRCQKVFNHKTALDN